jgi:hypothetical protein
MVYTDVQAPSANPVRSEREVTLVIMAPGINE